ncbi:MAG: hypothetical protein J0M12_01710 [Deltaproteobacteria bacterium]|nr:hypothetical protein [Deltaproteobacteria bacterium]
MKILSYYMARLRYPQFRDYSDMGLGIEARYLRCKAFWKRHLDFSKSFQELALSGCERRESIAILGAGRLLDMSEQAVSGFRSLHLFDADPTVLPVWKKFEKNFKSGQVHLHLEDLTRCISDWSEQLKKFLGSQTRQDASSAAAFLRSLVAGQANFRGYDVIVSLNVLSQLGVYWRDRVEHALNTSWNMHSDANGQWPEPLQAALLESQGKLEQAHLAGLAASGASLVVLIHDREFFYYTNNRAEWQAEPALQCLATDLPGYSVQNSDTWLWHIAPQGIEQPEYGAIHKVVATSFRRA